MNFKQKLYAAPPAGMPLDPSTSHGKLVEMVGHGKRVLEFGCASGYVSQFLKGHDCIVTGIEVNPVAAEHARAHCDEVIVADLDIRSLVDILPDRTYDVALFGDVLEHLRDPWRVLDEARTFLSADGFALISIPNVAHGAIRLSLLQGTFHYANLGILDDDHLRFFTLRSAKELCLRAGYEVNRIDRTKVPLFSASDLVPRLDERDFSADVLASIQRDPEHDTLQFIIHATPIPDHERYERLVQRILDHDSVEPVVAESADNLHSTVNIDSSHREQEFQERLKSSLQEQERLRQELSEASNSQALLKARIAGLEIELEQEMAAMAETREKLARTAEALSAAEARANDAAAENRRRSAEIIDLNNSVERINASHGETASALAQAVARAESVAMDLATAEALLETSISDADAKRATLQDALVRAQNDAERRAREINDLQESLDDSDRRRGDAQTALAQAVARLEALERDVRELSVERNAAAASADALKTQCADIKARLEAATAQIVELARERDAAVESASSMEAQCTELKHKLVSLEQSLRLSEMRSQDAATTLSHTLSDVEALRCRIHQANIEKDSLTQALAHSEQQVRAIQDKVRAAADLRAERDAALYDAERFRDEAIRLRSELIVAEDIRSSASAQAPNLPAQIQDDLQRERDRNEALIEEIARIKTSYDEVIGAFTDHIAAQLNEVRERIKTCDSRVREVQRSPIWKLKLALRRLTGKRF